MREPGMEAFLSYPTLLKRQKLQADTGRSELRSRKTRTAYGISGGRHDIAIVFSFNERQGVRYLGRAHFNIETGLYLSSELSCIAVNDEGTKIAIGSDERMGVLYEIKL